MIWQKRGLSVPFYRRMQSALSPRKHWGKWHLLKLLISLNQTYSAALVIADGAAFGPEIEKVLSLRRLTDKKLMIYLPESFEWLILKSGLIQGGRLQTILEKPYDSIDSEEFFSWERFFTSLLVDETRGTYLEYDKTSLNRAYQNPQEQTAIVDVMPDMQF